MSSSATADPQQMDPKAIEEARARLRAKIGAQQRGKKGTARVAPRNAPAEKGDMDKVRAALRKLNLQSIGSVEEVVLHKNDNTALHFSNPKVTLDPRSNITAVTGNCEVKQTSSMNDFLQKMKEQAALQQMQQQNEEEAIPDLVEDFETVADSAVKKLDQVD